MKVEWRRIAPLGLYLALLAALAAGGLYIVQRQFNLYLQIALALVIIGIALFAILDPEKIRKAISGRQARYGSNALVMVLAFLGILVVVNFIIYKYPKRWDLTADQQHTLSPETIDSLNKLPEPIHAVAFFSSGYYGKSTAQTLLDDYKANSNGKFTYEFIDPVAEPVAAQNARITQDGTVVLELQGSQERVTSMTEQEMTSGLIKLTNPGPRTVYFLTGHGEGDPNGSGQTAYSDAKNALETKNYTVNSLNLVTNPQVPSDALAVIIAGPTKPLSDAEVKLLQDYMDKGGSMVLLEEPLPLTDIGSSPDPLANYLSQTWKIDLGKDLVIDPTANPPSISIAAQYGTHAITDKLRQVVTIFPTARSIQPTISNSSEESITPLIKTGNEAWGETNFTDLGNNKAQFTQGQDVQGPITLAAAVERTGKKGRLVVVGDANFASDDYYTQYGNGDFFINSVDWAAQQDNLINLTPKASTQRMLLPPQNYVMNLLLFGTVFVMPGAVLFSGIMVWINRRKRG